MDLYLDTSCLLKVFFVEPETPAVIDRIGREEKVVVSSLTRLEAMVQIHARLAARLLTPSAARRLLERMDFVLETAPYERVACPSRVIELAEMQIRPMAKAAHCRTLDRLHLATMEALRFRRLLTNDDVQAHAARSLGFEVDLPR